MARESRTHLRCTCWRWSRPAVVSGDGARRGGIARRVPALQLLLRRAALHVHGRQPRRARQLVPAALRGLRGRTTRGAPACTGRGRHRARAGGAGTVRRESRARDPRSRHRRSCRRSPGSCATRRHGPGLDLARHGDARAGRGRHRRRPHATEPDCTTSCSGRPGDAPARWTACIHQRSVEWAIRRRWPYRVRIEAGRRDVRLDLGGRVRAAAATRRGARRGCSPRRPTRSDRHSRQDRLAAEAQAAEIARQSDALKSALLQSVSHDLRTPLATIRAAAGSLRPGSGLERRGSAGERRRDRPRGRVPEPARHQPARPVSRIEAGALRAERRRLRARRPRRPDARAPATAPVGTRPLEVALDAPPVSVDPVFLDEASPTLVENALKYTPPGTAHPGRRAATRADGFVRLTVEDARRGRPG